MTTAGILFMRSDECGMWQGVKSENTHRLNTAVL